MNARHKTGMKFYPAIVILLSLACRRPMFKQRKYIHQIPDDNFISPTQWLIKIQVQIAIYLFSQERCLHF